MRTVTNLLNAASKIDIPYQVELSLVDSSEEYIRIQKEQLAQGERSDGTPIFNIKTGSEYYSPGYARYKGKESPIDLKDKGDFYSGIFTRQESEGLFVDSEDSKSAKLQENYGPEIFTLNDQSKVEFIPIASAVLITGIEKELNRL